MKVEENKGSRTNPVTPGLSLIIPYYPPLVESASAFVAKKLQNCRIW